MKTLSEVERATLLAALDKTRWRMRDAAKALGLSERRFRYRCKRYGISVQERTTGLEPEAEAEAEAEAPTPPEAEAEAPKPPPKRTLDPRLLSIKGNRCPLCGSERMLKPDPDHPKLAYCERLKCIYRRTLNTSAAKMGPQLVIRNGTA